VSQRKVDFLGLFLIATCLGTFQVVLDKGQRDDWFASSLITSLSIIAAVSLALFLYWDWRVDHPIVNLHLFKNRNYATSNILMFLLGCVLLGSTVLIPQFLQTLMGYTAQSAGEVLTPGGFAILLLLPMVGFLVNKIDARFMIAFGFLLSGVALIQLSHLSRDIDFQTAMWWRIEQAASLAFLFVPINTIAYVGIPVEQNNQVSAMVNLMRNVGSSVGISVFATMLARRQQVHQNFLTANIHSGSVVYQSRVDNLANRLSDLGSDIVTAKQQALGFFSQLMQQQAAVLAYIDVIWVFIGVSFVAAPIVFLAKRNKPGQASMGH
jgi:MFS transporter, DHA2 family, multidrug resistance protein